MFTRTGGTFIIVPYMRVYQLVALAENKQLAGKFMISQRRKSDYILLQSAISLSVFNVTHVSRFKLNKHYNYKISVSDIRVES